MIENLPQAIFSSSLELQSAGEAEKNRVALSTAEAEYISLATAGQEAIWLSRLITELKRGTAKPVTLYEDNQAAICPSKNTQFHGRSKHIAIKYHFIRDEVQKGTVNVQYCKTEDMAADMMTKGLYSDRFSKLRKMAGVEELKSDIKWEGVLRKTL